MSHRMYCPPCGDVGVPRSSKTAAETDCQGHDDEHHAGTRTAQMQTTKQPAAA